MPTLDTERSAEVRRIDWDTLESDPSFGALVAEYAAECSIAGMPPCDFSREGYGALEACGLMSVAGAYVGGELAGFCTVLVSVIPHYGATAATTESVFVGKAHRGTGVGLQLVREAERIARDRGAVALFASAPVGGSMERLMPALGYRPTSTVFFRSLA